MIVENYVKISIVTPVYNNVRFIEDCIKSVLNQKYPNLEYIVIDGGSTDGTAELIEKYKDRLAWWVSEKDKGQTYALNKGFRKATGDIFCWLNGDEVYLPNTLQKVAAVFHSRPDLDLVWGNRIVIDRDGYEIKRVRYPSLSPYRLMMYGMRVLPTDSTWWSRRIHEKTGCLDEKHFPHTSMDFDWLLRISINAQKWEHIDEYLSKFTERQDRVTALTGIPKLQIDSKFIRQRVYKRLHVSPIRHYLNWFITKLYLRWFDGKLIRYPNVIRNFQAFHFKTASRSVESVRRNIKK